MQYRFLRFPEGKSKAFTMSYDDGCRDDIKLAEIISKYNLKCTFNHTCAENLTDEEVKKYIFENGHEIAVHGALHKAEGSVRPIDGIRDVLECRLRLEKRHGRIIRGMAYPDSGITRFLNGAQYDNIRSYLSDLDIVYSRTLGGDNNLFLLPSDWYAWMPTAHHKNPRLMEYINGFLSIDTEDVYCANRYPRLFYLWGHSYEFARDDNWNLLEEICRRISGHDSIWYATNIEIYNYVKAYDSLVFSADGTMVYNPTLYKIWFRTDSQLYSVNSGETLCLNEK